MNTEKAHSDGRSLAYTALGVFAVLCANELGFRVSGGEEQYMAFAKQYMDPEWIPDSFSITEFPGTRILFQTIVGSLLEVVSIPVGVFICRMAACAGMGYAMGRLFVRLDIRWYWALVLTQLFVMSDQSFFGMEWMLQSFEPKVVAYVFVFLALSSAVYERWGWAALWLAIATWFHFLVGGWMAVCLGLYLLLNAHWKFLIKYTLVFSGALVPLIIYLYGGYFASPPLETSHDLNWVYGYYRLPHHIGIFVSADHFISKHAVGVAISLAVLIGAVLLRKKFRGSWAMIYQTLVISLAITLFFVVVAWVDRYVMDYALAGILKFYPFRLSSYAMFATILLAGHLLWEWIEEIEVGPRIRVAVIGLTAVLGIFQAVNHIKDEVRPHYPEQYVEAIEYIRSATPTTAVFALINQPLDSDPYNAFIRLTERENFSVKKFVPGEKHKLNAWYDRQLALIRVNEDNSHINILSEAYGVTHIMSPVPVEGFELLYDNGAFFVYRI